MSLQFVDTHAHIHFKNYPYDPDITWDEAKTAGVTRMFAVGCDIESSINAVKFAQKHSGVYAVVGVHPHEAKKYLPTSNNMRELRELLANISGNKIVGIGEFGLDYFYEHSPKNDQQELARMHFRLAQEYDLPVILHVRDAFDDLWPIFDEFHSKKAIRGVLHSFTADSSELEKAMSRGLYVSLNGIITFTKNEDQIEAVKKLPIDRVLLETDAPYLTPKPFRGKICKPEHVVLTAEFLAGLKNESLATIADQTTKNAIKLFDLQ